MNVWGGQDLTVRTLEQPDAQLLAKWLSDPLVLEYYEGRDRPHDMNLVQEHFYQNTDGVNRCIIQYNGQGIGYLQYYLIDEEDRREYGYTDLEGRIFGMDQFIGETGYWNKGIGTKLINAMTTYLAAEEQASKIIMDPQAWNERALRVYDKCGFKKIRLLEQHEWHEGEYRDCWLIEYDCT